MHRNRWLLGFVGLSLLVLFLYQHSLKLLVLILILLSILLIDLLIFLTQKKSAMIKTKLTHSVKNQSQVDINLYYDQEGFTFGTKLAITLVVQNQWTNDKQEVTLTCLPFTSKQVELTGKLNSPFSGLLIVDITQVVQSDLLGILSRKVDITSFRASQILLPDIFDIASVDQEGNVLADYSEDVINIKAADNGEVFDFKEYEIGDAVKQIHWKLSVKEDKLIVKELSDVSDSHRIILLESHYVKKQGKASRKELDALLISYVSLVTGFLEQHIPVTICWDSLRLAQLTTVTLESQEELYHLYHSLEDISYIKSDSLVLDMLSSSGLVLDQGELFYLTANKTRVERPKDYSGDFIPVLISRKDKKASAGEIVIHSKEIEKDLMEVVF